MVTEGQDGISIPLGLATWIEPVVAPAALVEGIGAVALSVTVASMASRMILVTTVALVRLASQPNHLPPARATPFERYVKPEV